MAKLGKDLAPGDRLSLTGYEITGVRIVAADVFVTTRELPEKRFEFAQVVYLAG